MSSSSPTPPSPSKASTEETNINSPIVASHQLYLAKMSSEIRARTIPWEGYQRASLISEEELAQIRQFENNPGVAFKESGEKYMYLFLTLLQKLVRTDTIQNILVLIDDILEGNGNRTSIFFNLAKEKNDEFLPFSPFIKLLRKDDEYIQLKSAKICINLFLKADPLPIFEPIDLYSWITSQLLNSNPNIVDISVQYLQSLLSITEYRIGFFKSPHAMTNLVDVLKKSTQAQMQYQTIYVLWLLTFVKEIAIDLQRSVKLEFPKLTPIRKYDVIPKMLEFAKHAIKEKVVRVIVATLKNIILKAPEENMIALLGNKALNVCEILSARKWADEEIIEDLNFLKTELSKSMASLSTFDEYSTEVKAGTLEWSPAHNSEAFWKQNASRMNERDYELLRILSRIISTSNNPTVLAVAAHDFGQYIKHYPSGKKIVQDIGAKKQIMELMAHSDSDVKYQALMAVQKLMINNYES
ncbi:H(+)-transporting V1 sector ATPase subunit H [Lobulomyces angularis]|nr:H(+)-transporting V1 sector ATPase subunit H [Lobulomyces angularis]